MANRAALHDIFKAIVQSTLPSPTTVGNDYVYYQPPESLKMKYPAIRYQRADIDNAYADNLTYKQENAYQVTVIDRNPDSQIVEKVSKLPRCRFDRHYVADNLNHDIFTIYF